MLPKAAAKYTSEIVDIIDLIKCIDCYHGNAFKDRSVEHIHKEAQVIWEFIKGEK
jgi:Zn ribbon nucleic-acid-binding protein